MWVCTYVSLNVSVVHLTTFSIHDSQSKAVFLTFRSPLNPIPSPSSPPSSSPESHPSSSLSFPPLPCSTYLLATSRCCSSPSPPLLLELLLETLSWETLLSRRRLLWTSRGHRMEPGWGDGEGEGGVWVTQRGPTHTHQSSHQPTQSSTHTCTYMMTLARTTPCFTSAFCTCTCTPNTQIPHSMKLLASSLSPSPSSPHLFTLTPSLHPHSFTLTPSPLHSLPRTHPQYNCTLADRHVSN